MDAGLQEFINCDDSTRNVFRSVNSILTTSEVSEDDIEEIFDDTYNTFEDIRGESDKSSRYGDAENSDSSKIEISSPIDSQKEESLVKRVTSLKETLTDLRHSLNEEHRLWKHECEEYDLIHKKLKLSALEETATAARVSSEAYGIETTKGHFPSIISWNEASASTYKKNSSFLIHGNTLDNDYYKKLDQVERLCLEELQKIQNDADALEPLKQIVFQWNLNDGNTKINVDKQRIETEIY